MAEYIDKGELIKFLDNLQQPKIPITEGFKYITINDAIKIVSERPSANAIQIPDGATNGDMIKAMFPDIEFIETVYACGMPYVRVRFNGMPEVKIFDLDWLKSPYKVGGKADADSN